MPPTRPDDGMTLAAPPEWIDPQTSAAPGARVEATRQHGRHVGDDLREGIRQVLGQVRARGVSAPSRERDLDLVGRRGDGADAQTHLAGVEVGVAVQREDAVDPDEAVLGHDVLRASGHELLGGLEDETRADTGGHEPVLDRLERERRAEERRRVHVVPAGVADAVGLRGEVEAGLLPDRQGVDVGAQRDAVRRVRRAEVGDEPGAAQPADADAGALEALGDERRRAHLTAPELRMGVQVATDRDELCSALLDGSSDGLEGQRRGAVGHEHGSLARGWAHPPRTGGSDDHQDDGERSRVEPESRSARRSVPTPSGPSSASSTGRCRSRP